jgi:hypothetical protein
MRWRLFKKNIMDIFNILSEVLAPKTRLSRILILTLMFIGLLSVVITLTFSELKKQDITKNQLEIEKNRVSQIDKELSNLYFKAYKENDSSSTAKGQYLKHHLNQIEFLKSQRIEAVRSIDEINKNPDVQIIVFTTLAGLLTIVLLLFFSNSFKSNISITTKDTLERHSVEQRKRLLRTNQDFLQWITTNEIAQSNLAGLDLEKAKILKSLYDQSEILGEQRNSFLNTLISYTNIDRRQEDIQNDKYSDIFLVFEEVQDRLREECSRLNKQAIINLFLCFFISFMLMSFITYTSIFTTDTINSTSFQIFLVKYLPRIVAVVSLLTMFLYFTRLYKTNILDVKYYQNELTNIEIKLASLKTALCNGDKEIINKITLDLSSIERNGILSKEQTTSDIERIKIENEINKDYLNKVWELLSLRKSE